MLQMSSIFGSNSSHLTIPIINNTKKNASSDPSFDPLYDVPLSLVVLLSTCYGVISVLAVVGNTFVIWIVATSRRMHNFTNCFIANLALADIVIGIFAVPFQAALLQRWSLPHFMCPFCPFVQVLSVSVSIFTLTAIAVDRHRAILAPLSARPSNFSAKIMIVFIWTLGAALATPMALALRVEIVEESDKDNPLLILQKPFCSNLHLSDRAMLSYRVVLFFMQYLTPLAIISLVYARVALKLWGSRAPGNAQHSRDANLMKNKKKVIKMLSLVVVMFAVCWLPLQLYNVLQDTFPEINQYKYINIIFFCCDWLAMSNSCCNPFIYGIYNEKFKREFKLRWTKSRKWKQQLTMDSGELDKSQARYSNSFRCNERHRPHAASSFPMTSFAVHFCSSAPTIEAIKKRTRLRSQHRGSEVNHSTSLTGDRCGSSTDLYQSRITRDKSSCEEDDEKVDGGCACTRKKKQGCVVKTANVTVTPCLDSTKEKKTYGKFSADNSLCTPYEHHRIANLSICTDGKNRSGGQFRGVLVQKGSSSRFGMLRRNDTNVDSDNLDTEIYIYPDNAGHKIKSASTSWSEDSQHL